MYYRYTQSLSNNRYLLMLIHRFLNIHSLAFTFDDSLLINQFHVGKSLFYYKDVSVAGLGGKGPVAQFLGSLPRTNSIVPPWANTSLQVSQLFVHLFPFTFKLCT